MPSSPWCRHCLHAGAPVLTHLPQREFPRSAIAVGVPAAQPGERKDRKADLPLYAARPRREMETGETIVLGGGRGRRVIGRWNGQMERLFFVDTDGIWTVASIRGNHRPVAASDWALDNRATAISSAEVDLATGHMPTPMNTVEGDTGKLETQELADVYQVRNSSFGGMALRIAGATGKGGYARNARTKTLRSCIVAQALRSLWSPARSWISL